jgi:hypothetical protein
MRRRVSAATASPGPQQWRSPGGQSHFQSHTHSCTSVYLRSSSRMEQGIQTGSVGCGQLSLILKSGRSAVRPRP